MAQLRQDYDKFVARNTVILVIGPENSARFTTYFTENDLPFLGLPDPKASVLKRYGQEVSLFKLGRMPAQVLEDRADEVAHVEQRCLGQLIQVRDDLL